MKKSMITLTTLAAIGTAATLAHKALAKNAVCCPFRKVHRKPIFGIICAMDEELQPISEKMTHQKVVETAGLTFVKGRLYGQSVIVCRCGIGKVNAALCTQVLCSTFHVDAIINTGSAGSIVPKLKQGDLLLATGAVQHDMDCTALGHAPGEIPNMDIVRFPADETLLAIARAGSVEYNFDENVVICEGVVASGDQFIADRQKGAEIAETFGAKVCEMEGGAIAQVAYVNHTPFLLIRSVSDNANGDSPLSFPEFLPVAARNSCMMLFGFLKTYGRLA